MTKSEAKSILQAALAPYTHRPFAELLPLLTERREFEGAGYSGRIYALWDDRNEHRLRLWAELSYSLWTSFVPVVECELVANPAVAGKVA